MSFSTDVKEELSKINNYTKKDSLRMELIGFLMIANTVVVGQKIRYSTESQYTINRFAKLLSNCGIMDYTIELQRKTFSIFLPKGKLLEELEIQEKNKIVIRKEKMEQAFQKNEEQKTKDFLRGAFLGGGSINNPEKKYHLEIKFSADSNKEEMMKRLERQNIKMKELSASPILYLKEGEEISNFLAFIRASSGVLRFEEIRVMRDVRNNVNRLVNCETANLNKTINSAVKQIEDIQFIKQKRKFGELSEQLKEIAELRVTYPEKSFVELGQLLKEPIGKSGVSHRLKAISKFAEELRSK